MVMFLFSLNKLRKGDNTHNNDARASRFGVCQLRVIYCYVLLNCFIVCCQWFVYLLVYACLLKKHVTYSRNNSA